MKNLLTEAVKTVEETNAAYAQINVSQLKSLLKHMGLNVQGLWITRTRSGGDYEIHAERDTREKFEKVIEACELFKIEGNRSDALVGVYYIWEIFQDEYDRIKALDKKTIKYILNRIIGG